MIARILPWPFMSALLLIMWLLLNQTIAFGHIVLGAVLAIALPLLTSSLRPTKARVKRPGVIIKLFLIVTWDSLLSNIAVARIVLGSKKARDNSGFIKVPLDLRDPYGLSTLAVILTAVPGTVWSEFSEDGDILTVHVLDLTDETTSIRTIKDRYEKPLMEIFE
ncbi:Na+/H+ antiporter subunit E [Pigmentiphaga litoralis]|uniref:Multicomponent K+:H+ antiporter subunit E n=1 Tax=Pigmentiphaga litoralis TaxID=516702 RepID=A0A7Y9IW83_9BURK|nr:Na+/H+ antiporter subunit E [Pigmentiphaga litoralis]NYE22450.1 multicomponent K+:H+ antiporter subunit E [Pigmentiphaga litoralis]NYE83935.1 multicomponent K+:H+ antiporter subunit E [Pigmentiphaga litoralis]